MISSLGNSGIYDFSVGAFACTAISDGTFAYATSSLFLNARPAALERVLRAHHLSAHQISAPYTCLLIQTGQHQVLVDTGAGNLTPRTGRLLAGLRARGLTPADIDVVILSHGHPDQIGGSSDGVGSPTFPHARYVIAAAEWEFWTSEATLCTLEELLVTSARTHLPALRSQLELVVDRGDIVPGIQAIPAPGHTPGQLAVAITSGADRLLFSADVAQHPLHVACPAWYSSFDLQPEQAGATRRALFDDAARTQSLVLGYHFPFPGLGYVRRTRTGWRWEPLQRLDLLRFPPHQPR